MEEKKKIILLVVIVVTVLSTAISLAGLFIVQASNNTDDNEMRTLTIKVLGNGTTNPLPGDYEIEKGKTIKIAALPGADSFLDCWTGIMTAYDQEISIPVKEDCEITANFKKTPVINYTLTINVTGEGATIPGKGSRKYAAGTIVNLTAVETSPGSIFDRWTGPVNTTEKTFSIVMLENMNFTAHFVKVKFYLTIIIDGEGTTNLGGSGTYEFTAGSEITLSATPLLYDHKFSHFSGDISSHSNPATTVMDRDKTVTVHFIPSPKYTLTIVTHGGGMTSPPAGTYYDILEGTRMTISAIDFLGAKFQYWGVNGKAYFDRTITVNVNENVKVEAFFSMY